MSRGLTARHGRRPLRGGNPDAPPRHPPPGRFPAPATRPRGAAGRGAGAWLRDRLRDDAGYTTETVIVTALLAAAALAVIGIIVAKVTGLANSINM